MRMGVVRRRGYKSGPRQMVGAVLDLVVVGMVGVVVVRVVAMKMVVMVGVMLLRLMSRSHHFSRNIPGPHILR